MGLRQHDLEFTVDPIFEIDSYKSKMGDDQDIVVLSFSVNGEQPAKDLVNFVETGYNFVLDADKTSGEQADKKYRVFVELERNRHVPNQIIEILDGIKKLTNMPDLRFRYYKNFRSLDVNNENLSETIPLDKDAYDIKIKETHLENYKNFFSNSYAESIELKNDVLEVKNTYQQPVKFDVVNFGKDLEISETINMEDMAEVIWATKYLGDYNITKYGKNLVLENQGYQLQLKRI